MLVTESLSGVYIILVNTGSATRAYVGSTTRAFKRRKWRHWHSLRLGKHFNPGLQQAWDQCGKEAFAFMPIEVAHETDSLAAREQYWLDWFRLHVSVYNVTLDVKQCSLAPGVRDKISKSLAGRAFTKEHREKIRQAATGRKLSPETRAKISMAARQRGVPPATMTAAHAAVTGKPQSAEHRRRIGEAVRRFHARKKKAQ